MKSVEGINKCIDEMYTETEKVISALRKHSAAITAELQALKIGLEREIKEAYDELERTMYEDSPTLQSDLARQVRSSQSNLSKVKRFTYTIDSSRLLYCIRSLCNYSLSSLSYDSLILPGIVGNSLKLYDLEKSTSTSHEMDVTFTFGCRVTFIERLVLLVVGSEPASKAAFLIKTAAQKVTETRMMSYSRNFPGLIAVDDFAYVFGGGNNKAEKYHISTYSWSNLPDMTKVRVLMTPCLYESVIYLIDREAPMEAFDIASQCFKTLTIAGPYSGSGFLAVRNRSEIVIFSSECAMGTWVPENTVIQMTQPVYSMKEGAYELLLSQCGPILVKEEVHYVSWKSGTRVCFNIRNRTLRKSS